MCGDGRCGTGSRFGLEGCMMNGALRAMWTSTGDPEYPAPDGWIQGAVDSDGLAMRMGAGAPAGDIPIEGGMEREGSMGSVFFGTRNPRENRDVSRCTSGSVDERGGRPLKSFESGCVLVRRRLLGMLWPFQCSRLWRNWQTRQVQVLVGVKSHGGSTPLSRIDV